MKLPVKVATATLGHCVGEQGATGTPEGSGGRPEGADVAEPEAETLALREPDDDGEREGDALDEAVTVVVVELEGETEVDAVSDTVNGGVSCSCRGGQESATVAATSKGEGRRRSS